MPRRDDLKKVVILGSGPIRIGQAAEFDFSVNIIAQFPPFNTS